MAPTNAGPGSATGTGAFATPSCQMTTAKAAVPEAFGSQSGQVTSGSATGMEAFASPSGQEGFGPSKGPEASACGAHKQLTEEEIKAFDPVLFIGPHPKSPNLAVGVVEAMKKRLPKMRYIPLTASYFSVPVSVMKVIWFLLRMPWYKWTKKYKTLVLIGTNGKSWNRKSLIIKCAKRIGFKMVYYTHGGTFEEFTSHHTLQKIVKDFHRCDMVLIPSEHRRKWFIDTFNLQNSATMPTMVEKPEFKEPLPASPIAMIIYVSDYTKQRGVYDIINFVENHHDELLNRAKFTFIGTGDAKAVNNAIKISHTDDLIDNFGWLDPETRAFLLDDADVFLFPTDTELVPTSIVEAMHSSLPIIATPSGCITELVDDGVNGLIVNPSDPEAMYQALVKYLDNPSLRRQHGEASRKKAEEHLPEAVLRRLSATLASLLDEKK